jgi:hypothetical protein
MHGKHEVPRCCPWTCRRYGTSAWREVVVEAEAERNQMQPCQKASKKSQHPCFLTDEEIIE